MNAWSRNVTDIEIQKERNKRRDLILTLYLISIYLAPLFLIAVSLCCSMDTLSLFYRYISFLPALKPTKERNKRRDLILTLYLISLYLAHLFLIAISLYCSMDTLSLFYRSISFLPALKPAKGGNR